jgi:excisionase family DNA binding protein
MALLTVREVQAKLKCSKMAVHRLLKAQHIRGQNLPCVGVRIDEDSVDEFVKGRFEEKLSSPRRPATAKRRASRVYFEGL